MKINWKTFEEIGRREFEKYLKKETHVHAYMFTPNRFDNVDCLVCSGSSGWAEYFMPNVAVEIKTRNYPSTASFILHDGIVLEKEKYEKLMEYINNSGFSESLYVNIFNDGKIYAACINDLEPKWYKKKYHNSYTADTKVYIEKEVCDIPIKNCKNLNKIPMA